VPGTDPDLVVWRLYPGNAHAVSSVPVTWSPTSVAFDVPVSDLEWDDGFVNYILDVYEVRYTGGERELVPVASYTGTNHPILDEHSQVPAIGGLRAEVRGGTLYLKGRLFQRDPGYQPFYEPVRAGGWCLQLFINSDRQPTGYWLGYDYVVRGVEWDSAAGTFVTRTTGFDDHNPGGWGPTSGQASFSLAGGDFSLEVPLGAIGDGDGNVDFVLETYATVASPDGGSAVVQNFADDYFGGSFVATQRPIVHEPGETTRGLALASLRPTGSHSVTADRRSRSRFAYH
jgi:hypothetical protein